MITFDSSGDFKNLEKFLSRMSKREMFSHMEKFGKQGVDALKSATPVDSGQTAASWSYEVSNSRGSWSITWTNNHMAGGTPVAIMLQYGHGTGTGGYVQGRDYINPAIKPVFDSIAENVWKVVTSA